jgi:hydroxymethylbilane synthase
MAVQSKTIFIATRGSALALVQANLVLAQCRAAFPGRAFELKIIKTTGDKLQTASMAQEGKTLPKGLFTKELEVALLNGDADLAVHSLKDLPTELPTGLVLGAVGKREDVRDVLLHRREGNPSHFRGFAPGLRVQDLPAGAVVATSSTRRKAQLLVLNPGLRLPDIRGNVATRMQKLAHQPDMDGTVLALAGMTRLGFRIEPDGQIIGKEVPDGLRGVVLGLDSMLPCVGQGAIGIEVRADDPRTSEICSRLDHSETRHCVVAERAFLAAMGGGCQSPVAAHAIIRDGHLQMSAISFASGPVRRGDSKGPILEAVSLGSRLARQLLAA